MKILGLLLSICICFSSFGQDKDTPLKLTTNYASDELQDLLSFENIEYLKLSFNGGNKLKNKSYRLIAKEYTNGILSKDSVIFDSRNIGVQGFETINDSVLNMNILAKRTNENKLKISFHLPRFRLTREFDAIETTDQYVLKNIAEDSKLEIGYNKPFYLLAYILPHKLENGFKSYCEVAANGKDIENWGIKFGLEHYLVILMSLD